MYLQKAGWKPFNNQVPVITDTTVGLHNMAGLSLKNYRLISSVVLSLIVAWVTMILVFVGNSLIINITGLAGIIITLLALFAPSSGWKEQKDYIGSLTRWNVSIKWYLIAILVPISIEMTAIAVFLSLNHVTLPLNPAYWNLSYASGMVLKVLYMAILAVIFTGFILRLGSKSRSVLVSGAIFCVSLLVVMALIILAAVLSFGSNIWLFIGLIPAAFIAVWIYEHAGKSLVPVIVFLASFLAFELISPANWLLTGGFPEAMAIGAILYFLIAALLIVADRRFFFSAPASEEEKKSIF
jgi:hypothetical protein